ncbi:hypothetical protein OEZ86_002254 [Tetradesmus obliquus]|uniref:HIT-type domain-containing protein n=1 Tax=Tetradesmus obliquus TaxID=3088 RepID=A0A383V4S6_TETOB|nr:hypothetical protein OEZ86_002254 [Tetradesmus obliquus]|eukprot:jgi/Sobl393_1/12638/SZX60617.1
MFNQGSGPTRRETRSRKVSQRMAVVDESTRQQAAQSRLDALENDNPDDAPDPFGLGAGDEDDEFVMEESEEDEVDVGRKTRRRKPAAKRRTRGAGEGRAVKSFQRLVEESGMLDAPAGDVNYLSAAAGPSVFYVPRKFCSVCGFLSSYTCSRCGSKYCSRKCFTVHTETRCLKFMA